MRYYTISSGGITSVIAGGDFMYGAAGALIGYLTNHAAHGGSKLQHMAHAARVRQRRGTHMGSFNPNTGKAMPNSKIYPNRVPQINKSISWGYVKSLSRKAEPLIEKTLPAIERGSRLLDNLFLPLQLLQLSPGFQIQMQIYQNQNSTEIY